MALRPLLLRALCALALITAGLGVALCGSSAPASAASDIEPTTAPVPLSAEPENAPGLPVFTSDTAPPPAVVGKEYSHRFAAEGSPQPVLYEVGPLPRGLTLSSDGALTGKPVFPGKYTFSVRAYNAVGVVTGASHTISVTDALTLATAYTLRTTTTEGDDWIYTFVTFGGTGTSTFTVESGAIPEGMTLSPSGSLSGVPTRWGTFSFSVRATNGAESVVGAVHSVTVAPLASPAQKPATESLRTLAMTGASPLVTGLLAGGAAGLILLGAILTRRARHSE